MNKFKKFGLVAAAATGLSVAGTASAINIGGIEFDGGFHIEVASIYENAVSAVGETLTGYGEIATINGSGDFCAAGPFACELTYQFGGYTVQNISADEITFTGGWVNFYVGTTAGGTNDFNPTTSASGAADIAAATNGTLWLTLAGHSNTVATTNFGLVLGTTLVGAGSNIGTGNDVGSGNGLLDVDFTGLLNGNTAGAGAIANVNFDTNSQPDNLGGFADITLDSSFASIGTPPHGDIDLTGSATMRGQVIPAPATLALLGMGLLGMGLAVRRGKKA